MAFFRQLFPALLCSLMLSMVLQYVQGLPKPESSSRTREEKEIDKKAKLIKANMGATCKLRCPLPSRSSNVEWFLNKNPLNRTHKDYRFKRRHSKEMLVISKVTTNDCGIYSCRVQGKKSVTWRLIVTSVKGAKCRRKRRDISNEVDICKQPNFDRSYIRCQLSPRLNFSKCKSFAGDPENVVVGDYIYKGKTAIQVTWNTPRQGYTDLWGYEIEIIGLKNDANNRECLQFSVKNRTYWWFIDLQFGAEYNVQLRSLPSNNIISKRIRTKERCQYRKFRHLSQCCEIVNLNHMVSEEEGKIDLTWNFKCASNTTILKRFVVTWSNRQMMDPPKCLDVVQTSEMNYTIQLATECRRYNYSIKVYGLDERNKTNYKNVGQIKVHFREKENPPHTEKDTSNDGPDRRANMKIIAAVVGIIVGVALVAMFFIYKFFFSKEKIKLPSAGEHQERNNSTLLEKRDPKRVLIMHARCCEKCNWVVHCLGTLLNATNLVDAKSDLWHVQEIASEVMRWYQMEVRDSDCVLVLASNTMRILYDGEKLLNRENNDLLDIRAQLNLVSGEMGTQPNTPKFISAYFTYNGQSSDVPTFLNSRLTHQLTKDLDRLIFQVLKIEAIQPRRTRPIAVIGGTDFDKKKEDLLRAVTEAEQYHALREIHV